MRASRAAAVGIACAVAVGGLALSRRRTSLAVLPAAESTTVVRIVRRDRAGLPDRKGVVRDRARVRAVVEALGVDDHAEGPCPPDYAEAEFGLVLSGADVYAKRNVYVFGLRPGASDAGASDAGASDAGASVTVVSVTSAGCREGVPRDADALRRELRGAGTLD